MWLGLLLHLNSAENKYKNYRQWKQSFFMMSKRIKKARWKMISGKKKREKAENGLHFICEST